MYIFLKFQYLFTHLEEYEGQTHIFWFTLFIENRLVSF